MMTPNPCYQCPDRDPYCHATCQKYKDWKVLHEAEKAQKALDGERKVMTHASKKAHWAYKRYDPYGDRTKKFHG